MSTIDVVAEIDVAAQPTDIAGVMFDPARDPEWMKAVTDVEILDPALVPGARVRRTGRFLGRTFSWVTEVEAAHFPHLLRLRIAEGPFVGTVLYEIQRHGAGSRVRIRNTGRTGAPGVFPSALVEAPMRMALAADLGRLKSIVET